MKNIILTSTTFLFTFLSFGQEAGVQHSTFLCENGSVKTTGANHFAQRGLGHLLSIDSISDVMGLDSIVSIASGNYHNLALRANGEVWAWGRNASGELGLGHTDTVLSPQKIDALPVITKIFSGYRSSFAIALNGEVYAWGNNRFGQLGNGNTSNQSSPVLIQGNYKKIAVGIYHCLALDFQGNVWVWGSNSKGLLGMPTATQFSPALLAMPESVKEIEVSHYASLAVLENGDLYAWGNNTFGILGLGNYESKNRPTKVQGIERVEKLSASAFQVMAITTENKLYSWGLNTYGQLGIQGAFELNEPAFVTDSVYSFHSGSYHNFIQKTNGSIEAIGQNYVNQVGQGMPYQMSSFTTFEAGCPLQIGERCVARAVVNLPDSIQVCLGEEIMLDASQSINASDFMWVEGANTLSTDTSYVVQTNANTDQIDLIVNRNSCPDTTSIFMDVVVLPNIYISSSNEICENIDSLALTAYPPGGTWSGQHVQNGVLDVQSIQSQTTATYTYQENGCEKDKSHNISVLLNPEANYTYQLIDTVLTFYNTSSNASEITWLIGDSVYENIDTVQYLPGSVSSIDVQVLVQGSCGMDTISENIFFYTTGESLSDHNSLFKFYPNPAKDYFYVKALGDIDIDEMHMYTVLGEHVDFDYRVSSMGSIRVTILNSSTGNYFFKIIDSKGEIHTKMIHFSE